MFCRCRACAACAVAGSAKRTNASPVGLPWPSTAIHTAVRMSLASLRPVKNWATSASVAWCSRPRMRTTQDWVVSADGAAAGAAAAAVAPAPAALPPAAPAATAAARASPESGGLNASDSRVATWPTGSGLCVSGTSSGDRNEWPAACIRATMLPMAAHPLAPRAAGPDVSTLAPTADAMRPMEEGREPGNMRATSRWRSKNLLK
mmetsp:Transcript_20607/g.66079  ORF Transcript_20607/g.66079 Transcript_20607/m.66079 type:complete len:205 (-) Transcript_20607:380-994(-)